MIKLPPIQLAKASINYFVLLVRLSLLLSSWLVDNALYQALLKIVNFSVIGKDDPWMKLDVLVTEFCGCCEIVTRNQQEGFFPTSMGILEKAKRVFHFSFFFVLWLTCSEKKS
jgi:hypothetical protein